MNVHDALRNGRDHEAVRDGIGKRLAVSITAMVVGWSAFIGIGLWDALTFDPSKGMFPPTWVLFALLGSIGIAVSGGTSASRLSLGRTIIDTFKAGMGVISGKVDDRNEEDKR